MEIKHRELLRAQRMYLCEQLVVDEMIIHYLYQEHVLTESQLEDIQSQKSNKNKTLMLLSILPTRGPNAFNVFLQSLEQDFPWIKEKLLPLAEDPDDDDDDGGGGGEGGRCAELSNTPDQWSIPKHVLQTVPSDQQLNRLAALLGLEWEMVLLDLGLTSVEISRCRADHPLSSQSQVMAALVMWKQTQGRRATVESLLQSLQNSEIHPASCNRVFL